MLTLIVSAVLACSAPAAGQAGPALADVLRVVRDATIDRNDTLFNFIEVAIRGDVVILSGTVRHASRGREIERRVAELAGVHQVRNELRSPSDGAGDERLRRELARSVYGHSALSRYALNLDPPIRILVERGKVVLAGRVSTRVERDLLTQIALRSAAFEVENQVVVAANAAND
jgi:osmotically-inducible protein OsmY